MTAAPAGEKKSAEENAPVGLGSPKETAPLPEPAAPGQPVEDGKVEVTRPATEKEKSDPAGNVTKTRKTGRKAAPKADPLKDADMSKLPVAVTVGQVTASVDEYAGRAVLSLSLVGWVGEAPMKVLAADAGEIEQALAELRKELS